MKNSVKNLPEGYHLKDRVNFISDRRLCLKVNKLALLIGVLMFVAGVLIKPIAFDKAFFLKLVISLAGVFIYIFLHEGTHGIFMKIFGAKDIRFGFKFGFAYAGTSWYFKKLPYFVIALSPVIILGAALLILNLTLPPYWFWVIYSIQITNISGAAGDYYVVYKFKNMPHDILINDTGTDMSVYSKS